MQENEQTIGKLKNALETARTDINNMANKVRTAENKLKDNENELYNHSKEKERLGTLAREKSKECDDLKNRLNNTQDELRHMAEVQNICEQLKVPIP